MISNIYFKMEIASTDTGTDRASEFANWYARHFIWDEHKPHNTTYRTDHGLLKNI